MVHETSIQILQIAVLLTLIDRDGDLGHERETFREEVMEDRTIQDEVKTSASKVWDQNKGKSYAIYLR